MQLGSHIAVGASRHTFVHVPFVARRRPIAPDTSGEMSAEAIDPKPDCFPADRDAPLCEQIFNIPCAEGKTVIGPNRLSDDLARKTKAFQAGH